MIDQPVYLAAVITGAFGLTAILWRRTLLGVLVGMELLGLGAGLLYVAAGRNAPPPLDGFAFGMTSAVLVVAQVCAGFAIATRLFYLKGRAAIGDLESQRGDKKR